jgi:NADH-quinone oxidoreductase subunit I
MYCGICIEVCPFDALHWTPEFEYSSTDVLNLLHDKDRLGDWMQTVPAPPAHDVLGELSKEETAAVKKAAGPGTATPARSAPVRAKPSTPEGPPPPGLPPSPPAQAPPAPPAAPESPA